MRIAGLVVVGDIVDCPGFRFAGFIAFNDRVANGKWGAGGGLVAGNLGCFAGFLLLATGLLAFRFACLRCLSLSLSDVNDSSSSPEATSNAADRLFLTSSHLYVPSFFDLSSSMNESFVPLETSDPSSSSLTLARRLVEDVLERSLLVRFMVRPSTLPSGLFVDRCRFFATYVNPGQVKGYLLAFYFLPFVSSNQR